MGAKYQVFVDLSFHGRLLKSAELFGAEIFLFIELLEQYGSAVLDIPGYCVTVPVTGSHMGKSNRIEILLKAMGVWTTLWLEVRQPNAFVLYDR